MLDEAFGFPETFEMLFWAFVAVDEFNYNVMQLIKYQLSNVKEGRDDKKVQHSHQGWFNRYEYR